MLKRLIAGLCALTCLSAPVFSAGTCEPARLSAAIDVYAGEPFGPRSWRVLKGLGDPMVDRDYRGGDDWASQEEWKKLVAVISPDSKYLQNFGYDCRIAYPLTVLKQRVSNLGRESKYVKQWLRAQDTVLAACTEQGGADLKLPDPMEIHPALAKMQADDRAYQEASIAFYRDKPKAVALFKAIGASDSPHRAAARYNVANLLANAKNPAEARAEANAILADPSLASVHTITKALLGYIANLEDTPEGWTALINDTMAIIEQPVADINAAADKKQEYAYALYDIQHAGVDSKDDDWWLDGKLPENPTLSKALVDTAHGNAGVLWMMAGQSANQYYEAAPWSLIGTKWQARLSTLVGKAMAVAAASGFPQPARDMLATMAALPDDATGAAVWSEAKTAMAAAAASCGDDAQTAAAGLLLAQATRLSAMAGRFDEVYAGLEQVPFKSSSAYAEKTVLKLGEYLMGQGNLAEARTYRDRLLTPAFFSGLPENGRDGLVDRFAALMGWMAEDEAHWKQALAMASRKTGNMVLNFLPAKVLRGLAEDPTFSEAQRGLLARAAWTRDVVLGRKVSDADTAAMLALNPQLKATKDKVAADYPKASPDHVRLLTMLRSPRFGILVTSPDIYDPIEMERTDFNEIDSYDINDKNWWCPLQTDRQLGGLRAQYDEATGIGYLTAYDYGKEHIASVLDQNLIDRTGANRDRVLKANPMVKAINWKEVAALAAAPSGPKLLSQAAVRWGKASKGDDGAPEALSLAVRTTRYGCRWAGRHGAYSQAAHDLLQAKFKDTSYAKATPYWFDCMYEQWDNDGNKVAVCGPKTWPKQAPLK
jgi:hypothetical protein